MAFKWQLTRARYGFALGILFAASIHFPHPRALIGYGVAGLLTAMRFRALGWKVSRAFVPFAIAAAGTILVLSLGGHSQVGSAIARWWRVLALLVQSGMTFRSVLSYAAIDPMSHKQKLARDLLATRRNVKRTIKDNKPLIERHRQESATLTALLKERQAYIAAHGYDKSDQLKSLIARFDAQKAVVEPLGAELRASTEQLQARGEELKQASGAWRALKNNKAA
jgi:hypothetical protein